MGTINQPTPSNPHATTSDPQPLQPGGTAISSPDTIPATRVHSDAAETLRQEFDDAEDVARRGSDREK